MCELYEVKPKPRIVEDNIEQAVINFFIYGLQPGSYTTLMLVQNFNEAYHHAHPMLKSGPPDEPTYHQCLELAFKELPEFLIRENVVTWPGYVNLDEAERIKIQKSYSDERINEYLTYYTLDGTERRTFGDWITVAETHRQCQKVFKETDA
tara:strand:- start:12638 stop:13090 length:453 start_codon:yes stop_codon:yes gene_type:complete